MMAHQQCLNVWIWKSCHGDIAYNNKCSVVAADCSKYVDDDKNVDVYDDDDHDGCTPNDHGENVKCWPRRR